ncbi:sporulation protein YpjB [Aureibacillus halotolerans]|uniref:Sporulation protein YpjB n=1 Tax=Aureibacillus halotolerans TaxID=1508390 RepID=A0A4R6U760_9BACI|nr:sporulation protein YpjB [Aureibacillus halotolerans]TDQ41512.1 sporulation protein YpjB [Aureibacillus halotolerans]
MTYGQTKLFVMALCIGVLLSIGWQPTHAQVEANTQAWKDLSTIADRALKETQQKEYEKAKETLLYLSEDAFTEHTSQLKLSMDDMYLLSMSYKDAKQAVTQAAMDDQQRYIEVAKFRLLVDALQRPERPLWMETANSMYEAFDTLKSTVEQQEARDFQRALNHFLLLCEMIRPSVQATVSQEAAEKLQSQLVMLERQRHVFVESKESHAILETIQQTLRELYGETTEDETDPSFYWVLFTLGGIVFLTLFYTAWRKYRGEQRERKRTHQQNQDH